MLLRPFDILSSILGTGPKSIFETASDFFMNIKQRINKMTGFKTVLFNLIMGVVMLLVQRFDLGLTNEDTAPIVDSIVTLIWLGGNLVLRAISNTSIFKKTSPAPMTDGTPCNNQSGQSGKANVMSMVMLSCLSVGLVSCATLGVNIDSPEKKYLVARIGFNDLLEQYIIYADKVPMEKRIAIKDGIIATDKALDTWEKSVLDPNYDFTEDMQVWLEFKRLLLQILQEVQK